MLLAGFAVEAQPVITQQPSDQAVLFGNSATFNVAVSGVGPFTYQWKLNGTNLPSGIITTVAGNGGQFSGLGGGGIGVVATNTPLSLPTGIAVDGSGNVFIADYYNDWICTIGKTGILTTFADNKGNGIMGKEGTQYGAHLNNPTGVAIDGSGNVYIADKSNNTIRKIGPNVSIYLGATNLIIASIAGDGIAGYSGDGGAATSAMLSNPYGVAVDGSGNIFIADSGNNRIRKVGTNGIITTLVGNGIAGYSGDGGAAINAELNNPTGIAVDRSGNVFIADFQNYRIRKVGTNGIITTLAGNGGQIPLGSYNGDGGAAINAELNGAAGVAVDGFGNVFIADTDDDCIRKVWTNGIITRLAGVCLNGYSGDGGAATSAMLSNPSGVALDGSGNVIIADTVNNRIRMVLQYANQPFLSVNSVSNNNIGSYSVIITSSSGSITSSIANLNIVPIIVTSPISGQNWSNDLFTVTGVCSDNLQVAFVYYQINGQGWNLASNSNNWANWSANVTLLPGTNIIQAYLVDTNGNISPTNSQTMFYTFPSPSITTPTPGQLWSNNVFTVTGNANGNTSLSNVFYSVNNAAWTNATTANNWRNWTATANLFAGTNTIQAYAVDTSGNISPTNSVSFIAVLSTELTVNTNGSGTISPNYNGVPLQMFESYSMTATAGAGCLFTNWTGGISSPMAVLTNGPTLQFVMQSNLVLQANFVDVQNPTNSITSPTPGQRWSNNVFTVTGKSSDNVAVATVYYSANNTPWTNATTTNNWNNWTATANLISGTNSIQAYAVDTSGNVSATNSVKFIAILGNPLQIRITGKGTLSPNYSNAVLQIGNNYKMTAKPGKGFAFRNWTVSTNWIGGTITNNATVQFTMASNLTLQVTFADVTKPVLKVNKLAAKQTVNPVIVSGTASDNGQVANVRVQLNGVWTNAVTVNQWANWTASLNLIPGANQLAIYAVDTSGNCSKTNSKSLTFTPAAAAVVKISGTVNANTLAITDWVYTTTNGFSLTLQSSSKQNGLIQVSTNLTSWETLTNFTGTNAPLNFRDPAATNSSQRFYRAVSP